MPETQPELHVGQLVADAINAFLSAAALHLGESTAQGSRVAQANPTEAWLALMGASALVGELSPHMAESMRQYFSQALDALLLTFGERFPDEVLPLPGLLADPVG
ncbi:hypothetical protein D3C86_769090 [compost metagenome]